jgi:uncharacterized membrane protein YeaQ/YmgE (transglycosylase-associated protein family)
MMNIDAPANSTFSKAKPIAIELLAGLATGLICALTAGLIGARLLQGTNSGWGDLIGGILGAMIGYTIGVSLGVYGAGKRLERRGSYWVTLLSSVLSVALLLLLAEPLHLNANASLLQATIVIFPLIVVTIGFNLSLNARKGI